MSKEWKLDPQAVVSRWVEEAAENGEIDLRAKRLGVGYGEAAVSLAEELERPYREIAEKYKKKQAPALDEAEIDRRARAHADKHGVPYVVALEAVLPGSTGPVEPAASEKPKVDHADADLNRKAEARARREGVSYTVALEAVLEEGR